MGKRIALFFFCLVMTVLLAGAATANWDEALQVEIDRLLATPAYRQAELLESAATQDVAVIVAGDERFGVLTVLERDADGWAVTLESLPAVRQALPKETGNPQVIVDLPEAGSPRIRLSYTWSGYAATYDFIKELGEWVLEGARIDYGQLEPVVLYRRDEKVRVENCCGGINAPASPGERLAYFDAWGASVLYRDISHSILNQKRWGISLPEATTVMQPTPEGVRVRQGPGDAYAPVETLGGLLPQDRPFAVYGQEGGWLLVGYAGGEGAICMGYAEASAMPGIEARALDLAMRAVTLREGTGLRMSPDAQGERVLEEKTRGEFLALYGGTMAYVQTQWQGETVRAFVPVDSMIDEVG